MKLKGMLKLTKYYVKDYLTPKQDAIFFQTRRAKKLGMLDGTWTIEGQVFGTTDPQIKGTKINDLKLITNATDNYEKSKQKNRGHDEMETNEGDTPENRHDTGTRDDRRKPGGEGKAREQMTQPTYSVQHGRVQAPDGMSDIQRRRHQSQLPDGNQKSTASHRPREDNMLNADSFPPLGGGLNGNVKQNQQHGQWNDWHRQPNNRGGHTQNGGRNEYPTSNTWDDRGGRPQHGGWNEYPANNSYGSQHGRSRGRGYSGERMRPYPNAARHG